MVKSEDNAERMRRLFESGWNGGKIEVVDEIVGQDYVFNREGFERKKGPELYKEMIESTREVFPDMEFSIEDLVVGDGGNKIVIRWMMTGTHEGEYKGIQPTNQKVEIEGIEINRFEDGGLVESWTQPNWDGFLEDIGIFPLDN